MDRGVHEAGLVAIPITWAWWDASPRRKCLFARSKLPSFVWICMSISDGLCLTTLTGAENIGAAGSASRSGCTCSARFCLSRSLRSILLSCSSCLGFCDFFISKSPPLPPVDCSDVEDRDDNDEDEPIDDPDRTFFALTREAVPAPADDAAAVADVPATELNEYRFLLLFIAHLALHITAESESLRP